MTTHFRRGQSKVYYASEVWDPGQADVEDEEFARTSFRSGSGSEVEMESYKVIGYICDQNDFFVYGNYMVVICY